MVTKKQKRKLREAYSTAINTAKQFIEVDRRYFEADRLAYGGGNDTYGKVIEAAKQLIDADRDFVQGLQLWKGATV